MTSQSRTAAGKVADAALAGASEALVAAHPATALSDLVLPEDNKLPKLYRGGSGAITAIGEGIATGDTRTTGGFHEASKAGEYGEVMVPSSEAGDYWADQGGIDGLKPFGRELADCF